MHEAGSSIVAMPYSNSRTALGDEHVDRQTDQLGRERGKPLVVMLEYAL
jgi:hypothetical protein